MGLTLEPKSYPHFILVLLWYITLGNERGAEHPLCDKLQAILPIPFLVVWILDSFIYKVSTFLAGFISLPIRLMLAGGTLIIAIQLLRLSHQAIFNEAHDPPSVVESGVYLFMRHPMYTGTLLIYLGFILSTLSLFSLVYWIGVFMACDHFATYEENDLIRIFGEEYVEYQKRVPKWIPKISLKE